MLADVMTEPATKRKKKFQGMFGKLKLQEVSLVRGEATLYLYSLIKYQ